MNNSFRFTTLAGAIALAMGTVGANAATTATLPTIAPTQLPGHGTVAAGGNVTAGTITKGTQTLTVGANSVITWGAAGGSLNAAAGSATGFNIGSQAKLTFATGGNGVLNIDSTGNPSQIYGALVGSGGGNIFVANQNGVIVGAGGSISNPGGDIGLIGTSAAVQTGKTFDGTLSNVAYSGTGGAVTVAKGASLSGKSILIAGGSSVNVDLSALHTTGSVELTAGVKSSNASALIQNAKSASLSVAGSLAAGTITEFESVGNAMVGKGATVDLTPAGSAGIMVGGTFTNSGTLKLPSLVASASGAAPVGALVNNGTVTAGATLAVGSLTNRGKLSGSGAGTLATTSGGLTNAAQIKGFNTINVTGGDFANTGEVTATAGTAITVTNGGISNSGTITGFGSLVTKSSGSAPGFKKGADYSITNNGVINSTGYLELSANLTGSGDGTTATDSTGSINNQGTLQVAGGDDIYLSANNNVTLSGTVQVAAAPGKYVVTSAAHPLGYLGMYAANSGSGGFRAKTGTAKLATDIVSSDGGSLNGIQVAILGNLGDASASGAPQGRIYIYAGPQAGTPADATNSSYAVRVGAGKTVEAQYIDIYGVGGAPNVILQGTLFGTDVQLGSTGGSAHEGPVSDVFTGPNGGITLWGASGNAALTINSTGRVKTAPYLNDANNFRFNGLPVTVIGSGGSAGSGTVNLTLNPNPTGNTADMQGDPKAGINLIVNGSVNLVDSLTATAAGAPSANGTSVIGLGAVPNTHLVLQATGAIATGSGFGDGGSLSKGNFYWPGYIYLGNIQAASGTPEPGTAGLGQITLTGDFNNVVPGNTAGATGIHFMTQFPLSIAGNVITNDNAWVNFAAQQLVNGYATGALSPNAFFGGKVTAGQVITYGPLGSANFVLQPLNGTP